jgi:sugar/nucleoside kinase (ribokinase family)
MSYILGVGAALVDLVLEESDSFVGSLTAEKGGMNFVEADFAELTIAKSSQEATRAPGGSACNTIVALAELGVSSKMFGKIGADSWGDYFENEIKKSGVNASLTKSDSATGRVLSVVTPDGQRTMFTCLGAAAELNVDDLNQDLVTNAKALYLEGYLAFNEAVFKQLVLWARESNTPIILDLSSFDVIRAQRELLEWVFQSPIAILIANEDEAKEYTGQEEEKALVPMLPLADLVVVKVGAKGVWAQAKGDEAVFATGFPVKALDTTGAGDLWAAGFLSKYLKGDSLQDSLSFGNRVGSEIVQVLGAHLSKPIWAKIK